MNVIKARLDEIFEKINKQIIVPNFNLDSGIVFFLVGGGSCLLNIEKYCNNLFGPRVKNLEEKNKNEKNFVSCLGALQIIKDGWETEAIPEKVSKNIKKISFFSKFF